MKEINFLVPATPRSELHKRCFLRIMSAALEIPDCSPRLYCNIDVPDVIKESFQFDFPHNHRTYEWKEELDLSVKNINSYCSENNIERWINVNSESPSFDKAFNVLMQKAREYSAVDSPKDRFYFWLEDDWELKIDKINYFVKKVGHFMSQKENDVALFYRSKVSGPPWMCSSEWFTAMANSIDLDSTIDPEIKIMNYHERDDVRSRLRIDKVGFETQGSAVPIIMEDAGRRWRADMHLQKWKKEARDNPQENGTKTWVR